MTDFKAVTVSSLTYP